jgi:hypothetical protein
MDALDPRRPLAVLLWIIVILVVALLLTMLWVW